MWISNPATPLSAAQPAWLELRWPDAVSLRTVELTFDSGLSGWIWEGVFPTLVRDATLETSRDGTHWQVIANIHGNHQRRVVCHVAPIRTRFLRLNITATNGLATARVCEIRAYA